MLKRRKTLFIACCCNLKCMMYDVTYCKMDCHTFIVIVNHNQQLNSIPQKHLPTLPKSLICILGGKEWMREIRFTEMATRKKCSGNSMNLNMCCSSTWYNMLTWWEMMYRKEPFHRFILNREVLPKVLLTGTKKIFRRNGYGRRKCSHYISSSSILWFNYCYWLTRVEWSGVKDYRSS